MSERGYDFCDILESVLLPFPRETSSDEIKGTQGSQGLKVMSTRAYSIVRSHHVSQCHVSMQVRPHAFTQHYRDSVSSFYHLRSRYANGTGSTGLCQEAPGRLAEGGMFAFHEKLCGLRVQGPRGACYGSGHIQ